MEKLEKKYNQLDKALQSLKDSITRIENLIQRQEQTGAYDEGEFAIYRDSLIQRFEYCIDLLWKYLKKYLEQINSLPSISIPREVISNAASEGLMSRSEAEKILEMIKNRNLTSHMYMEELADQLFKLIPSYYTILAAVVGRLSPHGKKA